MKLLQTSAAAVSTALSALLIGSLTFGLIYLILSAPCG
jgi:hypothetical protein